MSPALKHAVILAHPDPKSFAASVAGAYSDAVQSAGQTAVLRDLYRIDFDPVLKAEERPSDRPFTPAPDVAAELDQLAGSDVFVLVYPIWFATPPAMLKGYIERVLGAGMPFERRGHHPHPPHPLLGGKHLLSFSSSGSTKEWLAEEGAWRFLHSFFDGYLARAFSMSSPSHVHFEAVTAETDISRVAAHLIRVKEEASAMCDRISRSRNASMPKKALVRNA